jgi:WD40 repeat protein
VNSPYKGLAAFEDTDLDALFFFGRAVERDVIVANLLASRLTVLYGESGVGKSSLLRAGVLRELRSAAPDASVAFHDTWSTSADDALGAVRGAGEGYLVLDQFEEYFLYHDGNGALLDELPELLRTSRVNVLVALREDALSRLDVFKAALPQIFANQVRLEHLGRDAARAAVLGPLERWRELTGETVAAEPELVDAVLAEVAGAADGRIEAPYLQLVLERIWDAERADGSSTLRRETLRRVGGAATIVRDHVDQALGSLTPDDQEAGAAMLEHLVTPSGTKIAHRVDDLAEYASLPPARAAQVLDRLSRERIVRGVESSDRYEIYHDVLAQPLTAWRSARALAAERAAARRRQRRLLGLAVAALVALAVVAGLAVWAFVERGAARSQARHAHARELEATALQELAVDPRTSLRDALTAARLESGGAAESVLRQALIADRLRRVIGIGGPVRALAWSPDGRVVAAAAPHGRILVADAATGRPLRTLQAQRTVAALGFAPDGTTLVSARPGGGVRAWNVATGAVVAASRHLLAATDARGRVGTVLLRGRLARLAPHVVDARTGGAGSPLAAIVADPGGRRRVWLFGRGGRLVRILPGRGIAAIAYSPDGRTLAAASADGSTTLWNARTGRRLRTLRDTGGPVAALAFAPDGALLATAGQDGAVRVWTAATGARLFFFTGHASPVTALAWSPDGRILASASADRTVRLWGVRGVAEVGSAVATLAGAGGPVREVAFAPDGSRIASGSDDGLVRLWDATPEQTLAVLGRASGGFADAAWAGRSLVVAAARDGVHVYDARTRRLLRVLAAPGVTSVVAAGGRVFAVTPRGVDVFDVGSGRLTRVVHVHVTALAVAPDGTLALARGDRVRIGTRTLRVPGGVIRPAFAPDGRLLATADADGTVRLFDVRSGRLLHVLRGHRQAVTDVAFGAGGALLATSGRDSRVVLWDVATGRPVHVLRGHFGAVAAVAFSPDGRWVATAGPISAGLWPTATGRLLFFLRGDTGRLTSVSFASDGRRILTSSLDGTVRTYACDVCGDLSALERLAVQRLRG